MQQANVGADKIIGVTQPQHGKRTVEMTECIGHKALNWFLNHWFVFKVSKHAT
jgi:hypothetical protein